MMAKTKVPVTMRALLQRINRKLVAENQALKVNRGTGEFFVVDMRRNVARTNINPEKLGRELGVLRPWEEVRS